VGSDDVYDVERDTKGSLPGKLDSFNEFNQVRQYIIVNHTLA
jgi:hypothetical protein